MLVFVYSVQIMVAVWCHSKQNEEIIRTGTHSESGVCIYGEIFSVFFFVWRATKLCKRNKSAANLDKNARAYSAESWWMSLLIRKLINGNMQKYLYLMTIFNLSFSLSPFAAAIFGLCPSAYTAKRIKSDRFGCDII